MFEVRGLWLDKAGNMETEDRMDTEGSGQAMPDQGMPCGGCGEADGSNDARRSPMAMSGAQSPGQVTLKGRELALFQAGQMIGAAQAYRQVAQRLQKQAKQLETEAMKRMLDGNAILNNVLGAATRGAKAGQRVVNAIKALTG
jgi:hypothetical protein